MECRRSCVVALFRSLRHSVRDQSCETSGHVSPTAKLIGHDDEDDDDDVES